MVASWRAAAPTRCPRSFREEDTLWMWLLSCSPFVSTEARTPSMAAWQPLMLAYARAEDSSKRRRRAPAATCSSSLTLRSAVDKAVLWASCRPR